MDLLQEFKIRLKPLEGKNVIREFSGTDGRYADFTKEVFFIRYIGMEHADSYLDEIRQMDKLLKRRMAEKQYGYLRLEMLDGRVPVEKTKDYVDIYLNYRTGSGKLPFHFQNSMWEAAFYRSYDAILSMYQQYSGHKEESFLKNFGVKMIFWIETCFPLLFVETLKMRRFPKFVCGGRIKLQEYLFLYFLALLGCDVLYLNPEEDVMIEDTSLRALSKVYCGAVKCSQSEIKGLAAKRPKGMPPAGNGNAYTGNAESGSVHTGNVQAGGQQSGGRQARSAQNGNERIVISREAIRRSDRDQKSREAEARRAPERRTEAASNQIVQGRRPSIVIPSGTNPFAPSAPAAPQTPSAPSAGRPSIPHTPSSTPAGRPPAPSAGSSVPPARPSAPQAGRQQSPVISRPAIQQPSAGAGRQPLDFVELAAMASSVVMIEVYNRQRQCFKTGSGVMIGSKGYILTNFHVACEGAYYGIRFEEEQDVYYTDELVKYNQFHDLAVLCCEGKRPPIPIYHGREKLVRGQKVVAIGSPLGLFNTVSDGIISGFRKLDEVSMIQFTAPISHGSSGGALLDLYGNLVGIITAGVDDGQNLNFAVDYETIWMFAGGFTS